MTNQKKQNHQQLKTVHAWANTLHCDRGTLARHLREVPCDEEQGGRRLYRLETIEAALAAAQRARGSPELKDELLTQQVRRLKIANDAKEGKLVPACEVISSIRRVLSKVDCILENKLCNEFPAAVSGLDVPQARIYGQRLGDQIRQEFQNLHSEWSC